MKEQVDRNGNYSGTIGLRPFRTSKGGGPVIDVNFGGTVAKIQFQPDGG